MKFFDRTREQESLQQIQQLSLQHAQFTQIDNWWSRNGDDEIDIIGINELIRQASFYEVKRNERELDMSLLEQRKNTFLVATRQLKKYAITTIGLSMNNM